MQLSLFATPPKPRQFRRVRIRIRRKYLSVSRENYVILRPFGQCYGVTYFPELRSNQFLIVDLRGKEVDFAAFIFACGWDNFFDRLVKSGAEWQIVRERILSMKRRRSPKFVLNKYKNEIKRMKTD